MLAKINQSMVCSGWKAMRQTGGLQETIPITFPDHNCATSNTKSPHLRQQRGDARVLVLQRAAVDLGGVRRQHNLHVLGGHCTRGGHNRIASDELTELWQAMEQDEAVSTISTCCVVTAGAERGGHNGAPSSELWQELGWLEKGERAGGSNARQAAVCRTATLRPSCPALQQRRQHERCTFHFTSAAALACVIELVGRHAALQQHAVTKQMLKKNCSMVKKSCLHRTAGRGTRRSPAGRGTTHPAS